jgi:hypothetical protein
MLLNSLFQPKEQINEAITVDEFKDILKKFLPLAKKIIGLEKLPTIVLKKTLAHGDQPTMGRFYNDTYTLELAVANRQPVDALRTLAHELTHALQDSEHIEISPETGSPEENKANEMAGIVMRHFNKQYPEYLKYQSIMEGGNLEVPDVDQPGQSHQADTIELKVHNRSFMVGVLNKLLQDINASFQAQYKQPLWSPQLIKAGTFLSGSSLHFFNTKGISDDQFVAKKPKVGDIDTQCDKELEPQVQQYLTSIVGKQVGTAKFLGFKPGNNQFSGLFQLQDPPVKVQIDFEFGRYDPKTNAPDEWYSYSHSSDWSDVEAGVKGVFHKYIDRALPYAKTSEKYVARVLKKSTKISDQPVVDADYSFAVAGGQGGGVSAKYKPYIDPTTGEPMMKDGIPVMQELPPNQRDYIQNLAQQFEIYFDRKPKGNDLELLNSFQGTIQLANKYLDDQQRQEVANRFLDICFEPGSQMITKNDPASDREAKFAAIDLMVERLKMTDPQGFRKHAVEMSKAYEDAFRAKKQPMAESILNEADPEQPQVKAQLRKGMPHLRDLKSADFLDLLDELHQGNGKFQLKNIPLNVKVDGFGGRFGKNAEGKPFMGTSRTEPRYEAGFVAHHQKKGTTDPDILGRAKLFDDLFYQMMDAIKLVDSKLGKDFLINKQVTCEVLYLPFATETPEGKLKFVGIHYDKLPDGVQLALVPFRVVEGDTGEDLPDSDKFIKQLTKVGKAGSVMFIDNSLTQNEALDVTALVPPMENIAQFKAMLASKKRDQAAEVKAALEPVKLALEKAIIEDPNIVGKDLLGKNYEGIVINSRLGPIKVTSQEQRDVIQAKKDAMANARTERPRGDAKTAVVAIGSFVGHKGHEELFNYTINKAKQLGGDPYLFIGNAVGKNDPIPPATKVETWHKMYPEYADNISTVQEGGTLLQKIKHELINPLPGKPPRYDNIVIMVGEDQKDMPIAGALMKAVNKFPGYEHVNVKLEATPRGTGMSFTKLRNILKDVNATPAEQLKVWEQGFDVKKLGAEWIKHLMDLTRKGMGLGEPHTSPSGVKTNMPKNDDDYAINYGPKGLAKPKSGRVLNALVAPKEPQAESVDGGTAEIKKEPVGGGSYVSMSHMPWEAIGPNPHDPDPMNPMIHHKSNPAALKDRMLRASGQLKDLAARAPTASPMEWQSIARHFKELQMNIDEIEHALAELAKQRRRGGVRSRGIDKNIDEKMLPASAFAGSKKNKLGTAGQLRNQKRGARAGDLVGGAAESVETECAGVGTVTAQNTTVDVKPNTLNKELKAFFPKQKKAKTEAANAAQQAAIAIAKKKEKGVDEDQRLDPKCWKGYRKQGTKMKGGTRVNNCVKIGEGWEDEISNAVSKLLENFADGKNPGRKGLAKRSGVNTKASVSDLRKTAKHSTGEKARMAHWLANMKAGKAKK